MGALQGGVLPCTDSQQNHGPPTLPLHCCAACDGGAARVHQCRAELTRARVQLSAIAGQALTDTGKPPVRAWTYGGGVPGPQVRVRQGDRVRVHVTNQLAAPTTVHWHGVRLPNPMDGVPHLTQAPIEPGQRFVCEFDALDAGTYWYHSHFQSSEQLDRGLYGTLIVEERQPVPVHRDVTWVLDDWRITASGQVSETFGNTHDMAHAGRIGNTVTVNGSVQDQFALRAGERIRLRLVNAAEEGLNKADSHARLAHQVGV